jgi:hypothetical protein
VCAPRLDLVKLECSLKNAKRSKPLKNMISFNKKIPPSCMCRHQTLIGIRFVEKLEIKTQTKIGN